MKVIVLLALWLCVTQVAAQSVESCMADMNQCLPAFRNRYLDTNYFWYGTSVSSCPGGPFCIDVSPGLESVMSRLLYSNDTASQQAAVANIQILNVTFEQPGGKYYACDTWIQVYPTPPVQVNPVGPTKVSQLTLSQKPHVTWKPRTSQSLYTVVMLDTSYMFLHAVYINCANGTMATGEPVQPYLGPSIVYLVNSPYVFMVFEQIIPIPYEAAVQAVQETRDEGAAVGPMVIFQVDILIAKLPKHLNPAIQFSVIMEAYPDQYGSSFLTDIRNVADLCPFFYSQLPAFRSAVEGMQIADPKWSPPAFSYSQVSIDPYLTSLSVNVKVTYYTDDFMDTACCKKFSLTRGSFAVSALDGRPIRASMTRHMPRVFLTPSFLMGGRLGIASRIYTLLMVDVTPALRPFAGGPKLTVHWLVTNIFAANFDTGTEVAPYSPPFPYDEKEPRAYVFLLFDQTNVVDPTSLYMLCPNGPHRCQLSVTDLINLWSLGNIVGVNWFQSKFDSWILKQRYAYFGESEEMVCYGREGYAFPCEAVTMPVHCSAIGQFGFTSHALIAVLAVFTLLNNYFKSR